VGKKDRDREEGKNRRGLKMKREGTKIAARKSHTGKENLSHFLKEKK